MKKILMIYSEDCDYVIGCCSTSYTDRTVLEERNYPAGVSDWEILEDARSREIKNYHGDHNTVSEHYLNRTLVRVVQIAREIQI